MGVCGDAGEALQAGDAERSIRIIEQYLLQDRTDAEIDGLMQEAQKALEEKRLRMTVAECSEKARALLDQGHFDQAIALLQPVISQTGNRGLANLQERAEQAKAEAEEKRLRVMVAECSEKATTLLDQSRFEEAVALLQPVVAQTGNLGLAKLQERAEQAKAEALERAERAKAEAEEKIKQLAGRIAELRRQGMLAEAIALLEGQPAEVVARPLVQDLRLKLREEQKRVEDKQREEAARRDALAAALAKSRLLIEKGEWQRGARSARESAAGVWRVGGGVGGAGRI